MESLRQGSIRAAFHDRAPTLGDATCHFVATVLTCPRAADTMAFIAVSSGAAMSALASHRRRVAASPSARERLTTWLTQLLPLGLCLLLAVGPSAWAQSHGASSGAPPADPDVVAALARFDQAGASNHDAIEDAATRLTALSAARPADPVLRAYAGAAVSMRALTTRLPWRKMSHTEDGLALIDKALAQLGPAHDTPLHRGVPASLETRFIAASTFLSLPAMFNRQDRGRRLLDDVRNSPLLAQSPAGFQAVVSRRVAQLAASERSGS